MALIRTDYGLIYNTDGSLCATLLPEGGVAVTEETTNLIPVEKLRFEGWSKDSGVTVTLTQNISVPEWKTTKATRIQTTGGVNRYKYWLMVSGGETTRTAQVKVKNIGTNTVFLSDGINIWASVLPGETKYVSYQRTATSISIEFRTDSAEKSLDFIAYQPGIKEKAYDDGTWCEGTRPAGSLSYDLPISINGDWTIAKWLELEPYFMELTYGNNGVWKCPVLSLGTGYGSSGQGLIGLYGAWFTSDAGKTITFVIDKEGDRLNTRKITLNEEEYNDKIFAVIVKQDTTLTAHLFTSANHYTMEYDISSLGDLSIIKPQLYFHANIVPVNQRMYCKRHLNTFVCPYAVSPETIATWHSLDAPFYDPREISTAEQAAREYAEAQAELARVTAEAYADGRVTEEEQARIADAQQKLQEAKQYADQKAAEDIDASRRTIYAPGVQIDSTGAWGISGGVKQAGFGTDGRWVAGGGSVVADETGLKIISPNGDYSLMDANQLRFFKTGYDVPYWYAKRVTYGIAEDGDYIDLASETGVPWDQAPKVITAINSLISYNPASSHAEQHFEAYVDGVTNEGFYVYCKNVIPATWSDWNDQNITLQPSYTTDYTPTSVTDLEISINSGRISTWIEFPPMYSIYQHYIVITYQKLGGSWVTYFQGYPGGSANGNYADKNYTYHISGLEPGQYRVAVYGQTGSGVVNYAKLNGWRYRNVSTVNTGRVMWIAIEGGAN